MALSQLVYMSSLYPYSTQVMSAIIETSIRNNARRGISGMLLIFEGNILQAIEGPEDQLNETYSAIQNDPRHRGIILIYHNTINERSFPEWSMGHKELSYSELALLPSANAIFKATTPEIERRVQPGDALTLLKSFL